MAINFPVGVAIARIQMPAAFDCRNEPFPPPFIETFPEINVVASVAIGWQRLLLNLGSILHCLLNRLNLRFLELLI